MITLARLATDNATAPDQPNEGDASDLRRITEHDPDYTRLHARTVRKLRASIRTFVRDLRAGHGHNGEQHAVSLFQQRHTNLLREAYQQAHQEGQRDYWQTVSRTRHAPTAPSDQRLRDLLTWYAVASVLKLAREGVAAHTAATVGNHPNTTPNGATGLSDAYRGMVAANDDLLARLLAGGDALDTWADGVDPRLDMQGAIAWAGLQDGYLAGGRNDGANPFALVYWLLDPPAKHCHDCPLLAEGSPYDAVGTGNGNELEQTPGDGRTECGSGCKCSLSYQPAGVVANPAIARNWQTWFGSDTISTLQGLRAQPGYEDVVPTAEGLLPPPGSGPDYVPPELPEGMFRPGTYLEPGDYPEGMPPPPEFEPNPAQIERDEEVPSATFEPNPAQVEQPEPAPPSATFEPNPYQVEQPESVPSGTFPPADSIAAYPLPATSNDLTEEQRGALDGMRGAQAQWDAVRGDLSAAPAYFTTLPGEDEPNALPPLADLTQEQRVALLDLWDAIAAWNWAHPGIYQNPDTGEMFAEQWEMDEGGGEL